MKEYRKNFPTLKDIRDSHGWKREYERYMPLSRYVYRPIGFLVTWLAIRLGMSTEMASYISAVIGVTGLVLLTFKDTSLIIIGIIVLHLFNLFDCIDGSIARAMKTENPYGKFLDSIIGDAINFCFFPVVGVVIFRKPQLSSYYMLNYSGTDPSVWLIIGVGVAISYIFLQHIENIYDAQLRESWDNLDDGNIHDYQKENENEHVAKPVGQPNNLSHLLRLIDRNLRARETHYFILIFAYWLRFVDFYLIFFLIYYSLRVLFAIVMFGRRALILRNQ